MKYKRLTNSKTFPTRCKYCGERVFYYANEYGSKVYFDNLGGTWPIHKCIKITKAYITKAIFSKNKFSW